MASSGLSMAPPWKRPKSEQYNTKINGVQRCRHFRIIFFSPPFHCALGTELRTLEASGSLNKMKWEQVTINGYKWPSLSSYHAANLVQNVMIVMGGSDGQEYFQDMLSRFQYDSSLALNPTHLRTPWHWTNSTRYCSLDIVCDSCKVIIGIINYQHYHRISLWCNGSDRQVIEW